MIEALQAADRAVLLFLNHLLASPPGDALWPLVTDYDKIWPVRVVFLAVWVWLMVRGGARGRTVALLLIPLLFFADKISSAVVKEIVARPRPCHTPGGVSVVEGLRMLVDCGPGKSFPSSHAVNNFAVATLFGFYYRRAAWALFAWAAVVALSRVAVGVHYPSDAIGGAAIGMWIAAALIGLWVWVQTRAFPRLGVPGVPGAGG
jgi:undecaprenyl-diphosphatase